MKYLSEELKKEYQRVLSMCTPIEALHHPKITVEDVLRAYFILADYFTDDPAGKRKESMLVGLRSEELLASALSRQIVSFGGRDKYTEPIDICSTLFFGLVKNHAFLDGNKRVSLLVLLYQLSLYNYIPNVPEDEFEKLVVNVAANEIDPNVMSRFKSDQAMGDREVQAISYILRRMVKKKDNSYHSMTTKEFCDAMEMAGVSVELENSKVKFRREIRQKPPLQSETLSSSLLFGGWGRVVGAKAAREIMQALRLYHQYSSYQDFLDGNERLYQLIQQFEAPLRRLKDE